jgi:hypothetical protein
VKDVFLSRVGIDKDWCKRLGAAIEAEQWDGPPHRVPRQAGHRHRRERVATLNEALANARFVALIMNPEMIRSAWCTAEMSAVLMDDPTNRKNRLIPIPIRLRNVSIDGTEHSGGLTECDLILGCPKGRCFEVSQRGQPPSGVRHDCGARHRRVAERHGHRAQWSWIGDDGHDASGRGWCLLHDGGTLGGMIFFHRGDSRFRVVQVRP